MSLILQMALMELFLLLRKYLEIYFRQIEFDNLTIIDLDHLLLHFFFHYLDHSFFLKFFPFQFLSQVLHQSQ